MNTNEDELAIFGEYGNATDASIVKGVLESNGVPCFLTNEMMSTILPLSPMSMGLVKLMIFKRDMALAKKIMESGPVSSDNDGD